MDINVDLLQWFINFLIKKSTCGAVKNKIMFNKESAEELHDLIIRKFEKRKVYSSSTDNIYGADLEDMQLISKFNKRFRFLLGAINIYSKYAWVISLKGEKKNCNY